MKLLATMLVLLGCAMAQVRLSPSSPPTVPAGGCVQFTATASGTWSMTGPGTITPTSGTAATYCAPTVLNPPAQAQGCPLGPMNNLLYAPAVGLPDHPLAHIWMQRLLTYPNSISLNWPTTGLLAEYANWLDGTEPQQVMNPYEGGWYWAGLPFPVPMPAGNAQTQSGYKFDVGSGFDNHTYAVDAACTDWDFYKPYLDVQSVQWVNGTHTVANIVTLTKKPIWTSPVHVYV